MSLLKRKIGATNVHVQVLPHIIDGGIILVEQLAILEHCMVKRNNQVVYEVLVHWANAAPKDICNLGYLV